MTDKRPDLRLAESADIVFAATVRGDSVRFAVAPEVKVTFHGDPGEDSDVGSHRIHLPDEVAEGTSYRAFQIEYVIASKVILTDTD
ncbi:hypothetical protein [Nonomuraea sp. LPB2021202275-12-8]|uniref:hypothetical protein n=1 Tax=Nonomuraea sp. LPB2021202275-12-8 TaxID=3120159 RepID=UPI00300C7ADE